LKISFSLILAILLILNVAGIFILFLDKDSDKIERKQKISSQNNSNAIEIINVFETNKVPIIKPIDLSI
jgi:hypothetical protein